MKAWILSILCFFSALQADYHYINKSVVNIHKEPNVLSEVVTQAIYATDFNILEIEDDWLKIELGDYEGWIEEKNMISREIAYPSKELFGTVSAFWSHLYLVEDTTPYPPAFTLPFEAPLEIITPKDQLNTRWMQVRLLDGRVLWTQRLAYDFTHKKLSLEEMLDLSRKFLRIPYQWGGTSSFGFDCSGFVQMLYRQMGIYIPRNSRQQANFEGAIPVDKKNLKPGDLIFFGRSRIVHVGMYLGNQEFIHSHTVDCVPGVQINNLQEKKWEDIYICSKRYIE